ncbi:hypothetical protein SVTN_31190 [Streptomyces vietnamensis]|uniref:Uncharacterized protein n=1 Tax=Streptomyces vietnamensis TaxID=362257 RepID=A0A0B5ICF0_9ACTN|nr:hypothetical protein SVTN_31190 [Streptomyces vietnamensis]
MVEENSWTAALETATAYECGHCAGQVNSIREEGRVTHLHVNHEESCSVLIGVVSGAADSLRPVMAERAEANVLFSGPKGGED